MKSTLKIMRPRFFHDKSILVDIVFEVGVALIGAAVTAYLLGVLLNQQQNDAKKWRTELRRRIDQTE